MVSSTYDKFTISIHKKLHEEICQYIRDPAHMMSRVQFFRYAAQIYMKYYFDLPTYNKKKEVKIIEEARSYW